MWKLRLNKVVLKVVLLIGLFATGCHGNFATRDGDCPTGQQLVDGGCEEIGCFGACPDGHYCRNDLCIPCLDNQHCGLDCTNCSAEPSNHVCIDGRCGCSQDVDCDTGERCNEFGLCEPAPLPAYRFDAGLLTGVATYEGKTFLPLVTYTDDDVTMYSPDNECQVEGTLNDDLYCSELYRNGDMTYTIPVENGSYVVHLHNTELHSEAGRLFAVRINGEEVLPSWDIYMESGGTAQAMVHSFDVEVSDGDIEIAFIWREHGAYDAPKICGIEILPVGVPPLEVE